MTDEQVVRRRKFFDRKIKELEVLLKGRKRELTELQQKECLHPRETSETDQGGTTTRCPSCGLSKSGY